VSVRVRPWSLPPGGEYRKASSSRGIPRPKCRSLSREYRKISRPTLDEAPPREAKAEKRRLFRKLRLIPRAKHRSLARNCRS